jgi:hypothetical protein
MVPEAVLLQHLQVFPRDAPLVLSDWITAPMSRQFWKRPIDIHNECV